MKKKWKIIIFIALIVIVLLLLVYGAKLYLWVKFMLGNDLLIRLAADNENLFLQHFKTGEVSFETSVLTNPFCRAECSYEFTELGENISLDTGNFSVKTTAPTEKSYTLNPPSSGTGQKLYRFDVSCIGIRSFLCYTNNELDKKSAIVTLDYNLSDEEERIYASSKESYSEIYRKINYWKDIFENFLNTSQNYSFLSSENYASDIDYLNSSLTELDEAEDYWNQEDYFNFESKINSINSEVVKREINFSRRNMSFYGNISEYNLILDLVINLSRDIENLSSENLTEESGKSVETLINEINLFSSLFKNNKNIDSKKIEIINLSYKWVVIKNEALLGNETWKNYSVIGKIIQINSSKIILNMIVQEKIKQLDENLARCCFMKKCESCCSETCSSDSGKFPIIFLHGHDFSASTSPEYNLNTFEEMQRKIEEIGYINSGSMLVYNTDEIFFGIWGKQPLPVSVKASYYFDSVGNKTKMKLFYTKKDNIDTYAIRLKEIVEAVKYKTNRKKAIIVTHSMGGVVARRYIQIFGEDSVSKLIMIGSPNNGLTKEVVSNCKIFGENSECNDMAETSLLMQKLKTQKLTIPVYNIAGVGCDTYGQDGDGVIMKSSSYLDYAKNYIVNGTCNSFSFSYLHSKLANPKLSPETYEIVRDILD